MALERAKNRLRDVRGHSGGVLSLENHPFQNRKVSRAVSPRLDKLCQKKAHFHAQQHFHFPCTRPVLPTSDGRRPRCARCRGNQRKRYREHLDGCVASAVLKRFNREFDLNGSNQPYILEASLRRNSKEKKCRSEPPQRSTLRIPKLYLLESYRDRRPTSPPHLFSTTTCYSYNRWSKSMHHYLQLLLTR